MSAEHRRITLTQEGEWWVATDESAGEHGVASQGRTREEALENLDEAIAGRNDEGRPPTDEELRKAGIDPEDDRETGDRDEIDPDAALFSGDPIMSVNMGEESIDDVLYGPIETDDAGAESPNGV